MTVDEARELFEYDHWVTRRLLDAVATLPSEAVTREIGSQFSFPTLKGMLAHILGAHVVWLGRWQGTSPSSIPADRDFQNLQELSHRLATTEAEEASFLAGLSEADLARPIHYRNLQGQAFMLPSPNRCGI